ncbi:MAG: hypothetical protein KKD01_10590 [Proteobacteria bacterium]|nr:hypothetical protein [Pseudomonadota bacterium]MBU1455162.1 hypothetical protein [Pseudomonadota bacterium]
MACFYSLPFTDGNHVSRDDNICTAHIAAMIDNYFQKKDISLTQVKEIV